MGPTIRICSERSLRARSASKLRSARPTSPQRGSTTRLRRGAPLVAFLLALTPGPALARDEGLSAYIRARTAPAPDAAVADYARALDAAPGATVARRAYRAALIAGDLPLARRALRLVGPADPDMEDRALLPIADAARAGDHAAVASLAARLPAPSLSSLAPALRAWAAWVRGGDWSAPLAAADPAARKLAAETRGLLLIATGRTGEGVAEIERTGSIDTTGPARIAAAELLVGRGEGALARRVLPPDDPRTTERLFAGRGARASLAFGVSRVLTGLSADDALADDAETAVALLRAAAVADPANDLAKLMLVVPLGSLHAHDAALRALDAIDPAGPLAPSAAQARAQALAASGRSAEALALAARTAADPRAARDDRQLHADLLSAAGRHAEAAAAYALIADGPGRADPVAHAQLGEALELAGDWPGAKRALRRAAALDPDNALTLNYLAYARITRGEAMRGSTRMLEKAYRLAPDDGGVTDSLGWAYHLTGDTPRALPLLERAAEAEPASAEIADHLGDAYWTLGRRYEARHAWTAAAEVADGAEKGRIEAKIADGLPGKRRPVR